MTVAVEREEDASWARKLAESGEELFEHVDVVVALVGEAGGAPEGLVKFCDQFAPHYVVVAASNKGTVEKIMLGSVCSALLSKSSVPVLVVRQAKND